MVAAFDAPQEPLQGFHPQLGSRALFPKLEAKAYLSHAAISPAAAPVELAVQRFLEDQARLGAGAFLRWHAQRERLRTKLAQLFGTGAAQVALTAGTNRALTELALAIALGPSQRLLGVSGEFPANVLPFQQVCQDQGASLVLLAQPDPRDESAQEKFLDAAEAELKKGAVAFAVSLVAFQTGFAMPMLELGRLCQRYNCLLIVDAIQAAGYYPIRFDEWQVDALVVGAHKWLLALEGVGAMALSPRFVERMKPRTVGWLSCEDAADFLFNGSGLLNYQKPQLRSAAFFESSTLSASGFAALEAGVDQCLSFQPGEILAHLSEYHDQAEAIFVSRGFVSLRPRQVQARSGMLCLQVPAHTSLSQVAHVLRKGGYVVSTPDGNLRLAPHYCNHVDELLDLPSCLP